MAALIDGVWLQQYVAPQLLEDFRNLTDDFIGVLGTPNPEAIDKDGIRFNKLINNIGFHVNKETPFEPVTNPLKKGLVEWDKMDTDLTVVTDKELRALAFGKESALRKKHKESFKIGSRDYVLRKLAPQEEKTGMPILKTTGDVVGGRRRLTYEDLIRFMTHLDTLNLQKRGWNLVLNPIHRADLMIDEAGTNNHRRNLEFDKETGEMKRFYKLRLWENNASPIYTGDLKLKADGAAPVQGDQMGSVFFYDPNTVYHIEKVMTLFKLMQNDTRNADPQSEFRLHAYGLCDKKQDYGFGAIVSANA